MPEQTPAATSLDEPMEVLEVADESGRSPGDALSPQELQAARAYGSQKLAVRLIEMLLDVAWLALFAFLLAEPLDAWLAAWNPFGAGLAPGGRPPFSNIVARAAAALISVGLLLGIGAAVLSRRPNWWGRRTEPILFAIILAAVVGWIFLYAHVVGPWLGRVDLLAVTWWRLAALFLALSAGSMILGLAPAFYGEFLLERRQGLSRQTLGRWFARWWGRHALMLVIGLLLVEGLFLVVYFTGPWWWPAAAGVFFLVSIVGGQLFPVLILPLFYRVERLEAGEIEERLAALAKGTGISIAGIYRLDMGRETAKANAMLTGLGRTRRVLLGDTLLANLSADEIEIVMAHELGHHVFRHIPIMIGLGLVYTAAGFFACDLALRAYLGEALDYSPLPVYSLAMLALVINVFSLLLEPFRNALMRRFERQCDRYAIERTGKAGAFISAFRKLARQNKADPQPPRLEVLLFHDHPPIAERIAAAERTLEACPD